MTRSACSASWLKRAGAAVMMVSDHGFGPCLGRIHVNRILVKAGVARLPGWAGLIERRRFRQETASGSGARSATTRAARSASFDQSVTAQYPFDWKRTLAFAPHQDTAAMVYVNCAARHGGVKTSAPRCRPGRSTRPEPPPPRHSPKQGIPKRHAALPPDHRDCRGLPDRSHPRGISRPDRAARRTLLGPHQADVRQPWVEPDPNLPGTHRPEGIVALSGAGLAPGRHLKANLVDATPTILALLGLAVPAHVEGKPIVGDGSANSRITPAPFAVARQDAIGEPINGPHSKPFEYSSEEQRIIEQRLADLGYLE